MKKGSTAVKGTARPALISACYANGSQMNKKGSNVNHVSHRAQNGECSGRQRPGQVRRHSQEPKVCSSSISTSPVTPTSQQRRWSADFSMYEATSVIIVTKNKKEPQPPQRGMSLLRPHTATDSSFKRYSCPPIGIFSSPSPSSSSSSSSSSSFSSSSTTSSCSSPPPVQTSVITGHDPLGWKLQPKSSSKSPRDRTKRLSLQIPLPVILPDPESSPAPTSKSDDAPTPTPASKTKPPLKPRRRHSDSSAFVKSLPTPSPVVTLEDLRAVHLRKVSNNSYDCDDVFSEEDEEGVEVTTSGRKVPPPVPEKSTMARQIAQLIALSWKRYASAITKTQEDHIYTSVKPKPKHPHQTVNHSSLHATKPGLLLDTSYGRQSSTPRFPGREI